MIIKILKIRKFLLSFYRWYFSFDFLKSPSKIPKNIYIGKNVRIFPRGNIIFGENIFIGDETRITTNSTGFSNIYIGDFALLADRVNIIGGAHEYRLRTMPISLQGEGMQSPIYIERDCWVCAITTILSGSRLPEGSILGSNSLLNKKMDEKYSLYAGIPAKFIKVCR
ncbi:acyltransferase [Polynucleobacter sp. MWH-Spelu-300-X4]|uniref:acyltransferase n=1 Tax=Polynucleobacter sp. MWH-Spelu-300-X4 TaxID=2689109 RepID=UPI001BFDEBDF|nr:acyltransferase [Polynucleobacter sp. MWH-Spelu-300-X4]QWD80046.1 acyltransferase [Polynucleobacter sp. MWH-Spelu-300-X4]